MDTQGHKELYQPVNIVESFKYFVDIADIAIYLKAKCRSRSSLFLERNIKCVSRDKNWLLNSQCLMMLSDVQEGQVRVGGLKSLVANIFMLATAPKKHFLKYRT